MFGIINKADNAMWEQTYADINEALEDIEANYDDLWELENLLIVEVKPVAKVEIKHELKFIN